MIDWEKEEADALAPARGCLVGLAISIVLWTVIIGLIMG